ncbi:MAG: hypothetical protein ABIR81_07340 [Ginsengibacter sp.]
MHLNKVVLFIGLLLGSLYCRSQTVEDIISKYITFCGGEQHWKKVKTITTSGTYNYGGIVFPFTAYSKAPNLYKYVVPFQGKYFEQAFDGKTGWKIDAFKGETKKTALTGKAASAMMNEADVNLEMPFINYKQKGHQAMLQGTDTVDGSDCFKVRFITANADTSTYFFKKEDYALVKKQAISKNTELDYSLLDIFYDDYRNVNGIKMPFVQTHKANAQTILTITVEKAEFNKPVKDEEFKF